MNRYILVVAPAELCALAVIAYLPAERLPFIADDYVQIQLGRDYGPVHSWPALFRDPLYRCRATSVAMTHWTELIAGLTPLLFNMSSLALHIVNCFLVFAFGALRAIRWKVAFLAARFLRSPKVTKKL